MIQKPSKSVKIATLAVRHYARSNRNEKLTLDKSSKYYFDSKNVFYNDFRFLFSLIIVKNVGRFLPLLAHPIVQGRFPDVLVHLRYRFDT